MTLFERVKSLAQLKKKSLNEVEEAVNFPRNTLYKWKTQLPNASKLESIANYFGVTVDYLLGRESVDALYTHDGKLHERINILLTAHNKTAEQAEKDLGFSVKGTTLSAGVIQAIADYFDASLDYLLGREIDTPGTYAEFHRVDVSDLSEKEKEEFEEEMKEMARFIQDRIRARREKFGKK